MIEFPKLSKIPKNIRPRTFWMTEEMDNQLKELQNRYGKYAVMEWLRGCCKIALDQALDERHTPAAATAPTPEPSQASEVANLDYEY